MSDVSSYPARLNGHLDLPLQRWRWLIKWFLAIPHFVVLIFLGLAFFVTTVIAGVSIAFTGVYPRGIFDFNVGVMRWCWRVEFYAFTFGTDRYPPFSLKADSAYPADLDVEYPERLSRGLVWVKWWLLAIPQYLIISFFTGGIGLGGGVTLGAGGGEVAGGLTFVLVLIAGVMLGIKREYPRSIFDLVMGMHRWTFRVMTYATLMRDEYPPFRLDMGPDDPR